MAIAGAIHSLPFSNGRSYDHDFLSPAPGRKDDEWGRIISRLLPYRRHPACDGTLHRHTDKLACCTPVPVGAHSRIAAPLPLLANGWLCTSRDGTRLRGHARCPSRVQMTGSRIILIVVAVTKGRPRQRAQNKTLRTRNLSSPGRPLIRLLALASSAASLLFQSPHATTRCHYLTAQSDGRPGLPAFLK